jgi:Na+/proline symporter
MGIGVGILLIVVGAILTFALDANLAGLDLNVVGWILMLAGVAGLILFFYFWNRRRAPAAVVTERAPAAVVTERVSYDNTGQAPATTRQPMEVRDERG